MLQKEQFVTVIGGVNVDITGFPKGVLVPGDSNPGHVKFSVGGVGRNIAENLVRLGMNSRLISAVGDDIYGQKVLEEGKLAGIDMQHSLVVKDHPTSTYMAVLDETGNMHVAISHMDIYDKISIDFISGKGDLIETSAACVIDTNIPGEIIEYAVTNHKETVFFLDTVSTAKAMKVKDFIGRFHTIKPNKIEAEALSAIKIVDEKSLVACAEYFLGQGVKRVFISLGQEGLYYNDGVGSGQVPALPVKAVNATGAGDAALAALVYCHCNGLELEYSAKFAVAAAARAMTDENTVNPHMSVEDVKSWMRRRDNE